jgi:hypothetical protein
MLRQAQHMDGTWSNPVSFRDRESPPAEAQARASAGRYVDANFKKEILTINLVGIFFYRLFISPKNLVIRN